MSIDSIARTANTHIDKAKDFRYFAMLGSFLLFLDFSLITFKIDSLTEVTYKSLSQNLHLGEVLIFFSLFAFFLSFIVPLTQSALRLISRLIPYRWLYFFYEDPFENVKPKDCCRISEIKQFAVKNNNSVAYNYYNDLSTTFDRVEQLEFFSLAFLLATLLNFYAYSINHKALVSFLVPLFNVQDNSFLASVLTLTLYGLYLVCFYFGVIRGCGFSLKTRDKVILFDHGF